MKNNVDEDEPSFQPQWLTNPKQTPKQGFIFYLYFSSLFFLFLLLETIPSNDKEKKSKRGPPPSLSQIRSKSSPGLLNDVFIF
jgi:hypothetical protein